jgi:hypothetical protein
VERRVVDEIDVDVRRLVIFAIWEKERERDHWWKETGK